MPPKIKCAEYSYIKQAIWDLTKEEEKQMMTVPPPAKVRIVEPEPVKIELLKCLPLENLAEKDGKKTQRFRFLACVMAADGKGSVGFGEKIANTRALAESKAGELALKNLRFVGPKINSNLQGKCQDVTVTIRPAKDGSGCRGSPLARRIFELMGLTDYDIIGSDNTLSCIRAVNKAISKIK